MLGRGGMEGERETEMQGGREGAAPSCDRCTDRDRP